MNKIQEEVPCLCENASWECYPHLQDILPEGYEYKVCNYKSTNDTDGFNAILRLPALTAEEIFEWKKLIENKTLCLFRSNRSYPPNGRRNIYRKDFCCAHGHSRGAGKVATIKTGCTSEICIAVRRVIDGYNCPDVHLPERPTVITIYWTHNHPKNTTLPARCIDVSEDTKKEFISLFFQGHTPLSALQLYRTKLAGKTGESPETLSQNKRIWPEKIYVVRLFRKLKINPPRQETFDIKSESMIEHHSQVDRRPVDVILPAAGTSNRMGAGASGIPKQFQKVLGTHLIAYTVNCFHRLPWIRHIVLVVSSSHIGQALDLGNKYSWPKVRVCAGGLTRHRSIQLAVQSLKDDCLEDSVVIIHDGARPFVPEEIIEKVASASEKHGAAGVVRPLVSTVIKPDKDVLESTLDRSDYCNSEMPQAFQYHVIAKAYEMCNDYDLDHGTECLLLALKYSDCRAKLVDGCPDLWKVTYAKDLFTMESVVKEKFTRVSLAVKSQYDVPYVNNLKAGLKRLQIKICAKEKGVKIKSANTVIGFLDLPESSSVSSSLKSHTAWLKHISHYYKKLLSIPQRLGLYVILVFVLPPSKKDSKDNIHQPQNHSAFQTHFTTGEESHYQTPASTQDHSYYYNHQQSLQQKQHQQHLLVLQQQQQLLKQQLKLLEQQQQLLQQQIDFNSSIHSPALENHNDNYQEVHVYSVSSTNSLTKASSTMEMDNFGDTCHDSGILSGNGNGIGDYIVNNNDTSDHQSPHLPSDQHHTRFSSKQSQANQQQQQQSGYRVTIAGLSDDSFEMDDDDHDTSQPTVSSLYPSVQRSQRTPISNAMVTTHSKSWVSRICTCQYYMKEMRQILHNFSISDICITSIINQTGDDLSDKLVELVWNRSRVLDGQVLMV